VIVIPNGIDYEAFRAACARHAKVPGRILFIGRLEKMKGVDLLLAAFAQLKKVTLPMKLHIVGDGSQRAVLESLARGFGIADRVRFLGRLAGALLLKEYAEAEIFCGLSRSEALGNVFLEAQAAGCAVVASDVDGIPEIVEDSVSGVLVEAKDTDAASKAMADLLGDAEQRKRFAEAGIERAKEYDWYVIAKRYTEQYSSSGISALRP
jgi:glycosyltransferase involved in cell wall biosynthesis